MTYVIIGLIVAAAVVFFVLGKRPKTVQIEEEIVGTLVTAQFQEDDGELFLSLKVKTTFNEATPCLFSRSMKEGAVPTKDDLKMRDELSLQGSWTKDFNFVVHTLTNKTREKSWTVE